jgi:hypothetical protein
VALWIRKTSRIPRSKSKQAAIFADSEGVHLLLPEADEAILLTGGSEGGGEHPNLAAHNTLGLATQAELDTVSAAKSDSGHGHVHDHDADYAAIHPHDYAADDHAHSEYVTDGDLSTHAATVHGTQAHAMGGVSHTGTLDHSALASVSANQHHNESHKARHASAGADALLASDIGAAALGHNHDASYSASGHSHDTTHNHDGTYATDDHTHQGGGGEAFPVGSVFLSVVSTDPAALLGYGIWSAFGAGRMLVGNDGAIFDTDEATGGAATHTHDAHSSPLNHTHNVTINDPGHVHDEYRNSATTGGLDGWAAGDTSTNTPLITGYDTGSKVTGITATTANPAGGVASMTHDTPSHLPPYMVVHMWKRTA